ncbi:MAG: type II secretion system protein [Patescibacteria group bacterium]|nr:type II secretion system protein [Patescibacteria group bacterium]MDD5121730.1 type II secretion system protein [Patescibacteria group bacterium]MDD5221968.1 type II secretion system protein [Patescibacteria group bacterium]MDD5396105.1 type II secretion system protein [Patescibacteria group bacterium]
MNHFMKFFCFQKLSQRRALTLVELMVVIGIIGILSAIAVASFNSARVKARDAVRAQNLKALSMALELYYANNNSYPSGDIGPSDSDSNYGFCLEQSTNFATLMSSYMTQIPKDPLFQDTAYPDHCYWYRTAGNGSQYHISVYVESSNYDPAQQDGGQETTSYEVYGGNNAQQLARGDVLVTKTGNNSYYFDRTGSVLNGKTGFYVMQYEAKYDTDADGKGNDAGTDVPPTGCRVSASYDTWDWANTSSPCPSSWNASQVVSSPEGSPIAGITHTQAISACPTGYHLITNDEWMAIARDAEQVQANWANNQIGSTVASGGGLKRGNVGITDSASYNGADPEKGLGRNSKAMLTLSNGSTIWDISGNVYEHVSFTPSGADATHQELDQPDDDDVSGWNYYEFTALNNNGANTFTTGYTDGKAVFRPSDDTWNSNYGVGKIYANSNSAAVTARVFVRGGNWHNTSRAGVFGLDLHWTASGSSYDVGFRCAR